MTFLAPLFFFLGLGVAAAAVALHFIVTRQPPSSPLPTARFVPEGSVRVTTVATPTDLWLLALRALLAIIVGAAFARPILVPNRRPAVRVVVADVSRAVGAIGAVRDSARALLSDGDVLVVFDSAARIVRHGVADSAAKLERSERPGRLSVALIAALRGAAHVRTAADSIELVIVSPFRAAEFDGATAELRKLWPGRIRLVRVPPSADSIGQTVGFAVQAAAGDPVGLAASMTKAAPGRNVTVRIVRGTVTSDDSAWAGAGRHTLVRWPAEGAPPGWVARDTADTVGAVVVGQVALVVPLERRWRVDAAARPARITARWVDGEPAAVEYVVGNGCLRDVAIPVPVRGDIMLRPSFARLLEALGAPCAAMPGGAGLADQELEELGGSGPLAVAAMIAPPDTIVTPLVPWLLGLALVLAVVEMLVRRSKR
jgi:hypothetical protein